MGFFGVFVALMSTGAAMAADPVNGWRWVWRTQLICNGIILIGIAVVYRVSIRDLLEGPTEIE